MSVRASAVAAFAAGLFLGLASPARGQSGIPTEPRPYFYLWGAPNSGGWGSNLIPYASQMIRVDARQSPQAAAQDAVDAIVDQTDPPHPTTDAGHICIVIEAFGMWYETQSHPSSFLHDDDAIAPVPDWDPPPPNLEDPAMPLLQPWAEKGREEAKEWMEAFLDHYKNVLQGPAPARFHFDTEISFSGCCAVNYTRILEAMTQDDRWDVTPVPGSADYMLSSGGVNKTMAEMYDEAQVVFGWPDVPLQNAILRDFSVIEAGADQNRRYFLWYWEICQRAVDASMKECAYDVIEDYYPAAQYPNVKASNYNDCDTDGKADTFGWYTGRENTGSMINSLNAPPFTPQRKSVRGVVSGGGTAGHYYWSDFVQTDPSTQDEVRRSIWITSPGVASGDFSAPVIYPPHPWVHWAGAERKNYYLPLTGNPLDWQQITPGRITWENSRRDVESIINSPGGSSQAIVPWIAPGGTLFTYGQGAPTYTWTHNDLRDILAMLRAKMTPEINLWWNDTDPYPDPEWDVLKVIMDRVYIPQLNLIRVHAGTCTNCPTPPTPIPVDRLRYTLRNPGDPTQEYVEVATSGPTTPPQVALLARFGNMQTLGASSPATLNLECAVDTGIDGPIGGIRGKVYVWEWTTSTWQLQDIVDDFGALDGEGFGFFAPRNSESPNQGFYETRRIFENLQKFVNSSGNMDVKIVLQQTEGVSGFTARFNLVQLLGEPEIASSFASQPQGADFNHTQEVSLVDIDGFYAAYNAGEPAADFNNDGVVTPQDLTEYTAAYINSP